MKNVIFAIVFLALGVGGAFAYLKFGRGSSATPDSSEVAPAAVIMCVEHAVAESICPFCNPELIESGGHCAEHDVPEALCTRCNDDLIPAFEAVNDWCAEHNVPESQCVLCSHSELNPESDG